MIDSGLYKLPSFAVFLLASLSLCAAGCATNSRTLDTTPEALASSVSIGDHLYIVTKTGEELDISVTAVDETGISGNGKRIAYEEIQSVSVQPGKSDNTSTIVLITLAVVVALAALLLQIESDLEEGLFQSSN